MEYIHLKRMGNRLAFVLIMVASLIFARPANGAGPGGGGHGGGGGHAAGGRGMGPGGPNHGGFGPGPSFRGHPYGYGGFGLGIGYGYYGYGYGYPYYGGFGYPYNYGYQYYDPGYPVYVDPAIATNGLSAPSSQPSGQGNLLPPPQVRFSDTDLMLSVRVPAVDAVVSINGARTNQSGPRREFMSSGLTPGRSYSYEIRAQWTDENGKPVDTNRRIAVQAGERRTIDFALPPADAK